MSLSLHRDILGGSIIATKILNPKYKLGSAHRSSQHLFCFNGKVVQYYQSHTTGLKLNSTVKVTQSVQGLMMWLGLQS